MTTESLAQASNAAIYATMVTLAAAMVAFAVSFAAGRRRDSGVVITESEVGAGSTAVLTRTQVETEAPGRRSANIGMSLTWLATALLLVGVVLRGLWAERVPWGNMYEFSITSALGILIVFLILSLRSDVRWLGLFVVIPVLLTLGLAVTVLYTEAAQLVPALKSYWLVIHVSAAIVCGGAFTIAGASAGLALLRGWRERVAVAQGRPAADVMHRVPSVPALETFTYRIIAFSFPLWTFAVVSGAIWAENAWGRYWGWDPKETWAFITWVVYAAYLHARSTKGWRGSRASWIAIIGFASFLINYFGVNLFVNSLHSYAGVG